MRCEQCSKFVSFDTDTEPEINITVDDEGSVTGDVRIVNTCAECSTELKETTFSVDEDFSTEIAEHRNAEGEVPEGEPVPEGEEPKVHKELSVDHDGGSRNDRTQSTDRHGKPIKSSRYMKRFYGAEMTITVTCECGETFERAWSDEVQASGMEEL